MNLNNEIQLLLCDFCSYGMLLADPRVALIIRAPWCSCFV